MPLHPQARAVIEMREAAGLPEMHTLTPQQARDQLAAQRAAAPVAAVAPVHRVEDRTIPGADGQLPARIYWPSDERGLPLLVWFHGGGWVIGDLDQTDASCRALTNKSGAIVVSVEYRKAPEFPFPAPAEDAYASVVWAAEHAEELGANPDLLAVGGASAGGNLAAVASLMARDRGGPRIVHQLLVYPVTDYGFDRPSYRENGEGCGLSQESMVWFWNHYVGAGGDGANPYASPLRAERLEGLPRAHVITAEYDVLRDEGEEYAERLREAGVPTVCTRYDGQIHGFFGMTAMLDDAMRAIEEAAGELKQSFAAGARAGE